MSMPPQNTLHAESRTTSFTSGLWPANVMPLREPSRRNASLRKIAGSGRLSVNARDAAVDAHLDVFELLWCALTRVATTYSCASTGSIMSRLSAGNCRSTVRSEAAMGKDQICMLPRRTLQRFRSSERTRAQKACPSISAFFRRYAVLFRGILRTSRPFPAQCNISLFAGMLGYELFLSCAGCTAWWLEKHSSARDADDGGRRDTCRRNGFDGRIFSEMRCGMALSWRSASDRDWQGRNDDPQRDNRGATAGGLTRLFICDFSRVIGASTVFPEAEPNGRRRTQLWERDCCGGISCSPAGSACGQSYKEFEVTPKRLLD